MAAAKKVAARARKLRDEALNYARTDKFADAAKLFETLCDLEPDEPEWPRRAADCYLQLKNNNKRLKFSLLAAKKYSEAGRLLKAIAMCKVVLSIDPQHTESQNELARLHARRPGPDRKLAPSPAKKRRPLQPVPAKHRATTTRARMVAETALRELRARRAVAAKGSTLNHPSPVPPATAAAKGPAAPSPSPASEATPVPSRPTAEAALPAGESPQSSGTLPSAPPVVPSSPLPLAAPLPLAVPIPVAPNGFYSANGLEEAIFGAPSSRQTSSSPPASFSPASRTPVVPLNAAPSVPPFSSLPPLSRAPLQSISLSAHLPSQSKPPSPASGGHVYSLTLSDIPSAELQAAQLPALSSPLQPSVKGAKLLLEQELFEEAPEQLEQEPAQSDFKQHNDEQLDSQQFELEPFENEPTSELPDSWAQSTFERIPLLTELSPEALQLLIGELELVELSSGELLFQQGAIADSMYVVVEGIVAASVHNEGEDPIELAQLGEGEFFGEIGLLSDQPRQAAVRALQDTRLLRFNRESIGALIDREPEFLAHLLEFLRGRLVESLTLTSPLFAPFDQVESRRLADFFEFLEIEADSILMDQGQRPVGLYILLTGEALSTRADSPQALGRLGPGDVFGQGALLENRTSSSRVRTLTKCYALCLPSDCFFEVIMTHPTVLAYLSTVREITAEAAPPQSEEGDEHLTLF